MTFFLKLQEFFLHLYTLLVGTEVLKEKAVLQQKAWAI